MPARMWWGLLASFTRNRFNAYCCRRKGDYSLVLMFVPIWICFLPPPQKKTCKVWPSNWQNTNLVKMRHCLKLRGFGDGRKDNKLSHYYKNNLSSSPAGSQKSAEKDVRKWSRGRWEEKVSAPLDTIPWLKKTLLGHHAKRSLGYMSP